MIVGLEKEEGIRRRLGAIVFADVVGYTRMMGDNETVTYLALEQTIARLEASCREADGELIEVRGDGILALFESVTGAVTFAVQMQKTLADEQQEAPEEQRILFRVGINVGEIIADHRGIHGDSVNIAARLQALAEPGRVLISGAVYEHIRNKLPFGFEYLGPRELKNVREPVPVYCVRAEREGVVMAPSVRMDIAEGRRLRSEGPSVAVLPFEPLGGEDSDNWFADGITEDITLNLSKFKNLFVIARNSSFLYKSRTVRPQEAARELGVRYVTRGSIRRAGTRMRLTIELMDADSERTIWGEHYDRDLEDVFAVQDEMTEIIVAAAAVHIEANERLRARQQTSDLAAYGYVLQGQQHIFQYTRRDNSRAKELYQKALDSDQRYARANAALSRTLNLDYLYSWTDEPEGVLDKALSYAQEAVELDPTDARGFGELGFVHLYRKAHDTSLNAYKRALSLNPNDADLLSDFADALAHAGSSEEAIRQLERAMRLNPYYPDQYLRHLGGAYYNLKEYDLVIETVVKMNNPTEGQRLLAASYAQLGRMSEARDIVEKHRQVHPDFSPEHWSKVVPDRNEADVVHYYEGLKKAGF